jgi:hypothetical protein
VAMDRYMKCTIIQIVTIGEIIMAKPIEKEPKGYQRADRDVQRSQTYLQNLF